MLTYTGKYNSAQVMTDTIDEETVKQIYSFLNHPAFQKTRIVIMPDCHAGAGAVIGFTAQMNDYVIPNVVGVDIGCGIETFNLGQWDIDFESLDRFIRKYIPAGFNVRERPLQIPQDLDSLIDIIGNKIEKCDANRARCSIGTLGGGNHFIELNQDPDNNIWLTIHTGSRKFGLDIATYHQRKAQALMKEMFIGSAYKQLEFLPIDGDGGEYLDDMMIAQKYAEHNRFEIASIILEGYFNIDIKAIETIKSIHNYINFNDNIIRKGAISAHYGEKVIIPLNMRDGSIIGTGKGNSVWNFSAPHGAGRILSRKQAKATLTVEEFTKQMDGIWTSCINKDTLDESPMAYKDKRVILDTIEETVDINFIMKPIYNFKGS